eukprot:1140734-Pelagomonas_calceolata.AAC.3
MERKGGHLGVLRTPCDSAPGTDGISDTVLRDYKPVAIGMLRAPPTGPFCTESLLLPLNASVSTYFKFGMKQGLTKTEL